MVFLVKVLDFLMKRLNVELEELFGIQSKGWSQALSRQEGGSCFAFPLD